MIKKHIALALAAAAILSGAGAAVGEFARLGTRGALVPAIFHDEAAWFKRVPIETRRALSVSSTFRKLDVNALGLAPVAAELQAAKIAPKEFAAIKDESARERLAEEIRRAASLRVSARARLFKDRLNNARAFFSAYGACPRELERDMESAVPGLGLIVEYLPDYLEPGLLAEAKRARDMGLELERSAGSNLRAAVLLAKALGGAAEGAPSNRAADDLEEFIRYRTPGEPAQAALAAALERRMKARPTEAARAALKALAARTSYPSVRETSLAALREPPRDSLDAASGPKSDRARSERPAAERREFSPKGAGETAGAKKASDAGKKHWTTTRALAAAGWVSSWPLMRWLERVIPPSRIAGIDGSDAGLHALLTGAIALLLAYWIFGSEDFTGRKRND